MELTNKGEDMYKRVCESLADYGKYIPKDSDIFKVVNQDKDFYSSIYYYNEEQVKKAEIEVEVDGKKRPRGISGITDVVTDKLVWDFDDAKNPDKAKRNTISLVIKLKSLGIKEEDVSICFSGKKGFAVEVMTKQMFSPKEFKAITSKLASGLETYDSVVANPSRIFRIPLTKHNSSGLYKIPLSFEELRQGSMTQIKELAKSKPDLNDPLLKINPTDVHFDVPEIAPQKPKTASVSSSTPYMRVDYVRNPFNLIPWKLAIQQGIFPAGSRNEALMILGATLKAKGLDRNDCYFQLKSTSDKQSKLFEQDKYGKEEIWKNIISVIYGELWSGATYSTGNFSDQLRTFYGDLGIPEINGSENTDNKPIELQDLYGTFASYAENIDKNTVRTGIKELDGIVNIQTQMLVGLLGTAGSGKTSLALQIMKNLSLEQEDSMFFSMDMSTAQVYEKLARSSTDYKPDEIMRAFKDGKEHIKTDIRENVSSNYENVKLNFKSSQSVADMKNSIVEYEERTGRKIRLVVVDYLEKIAGTHSDPTVSSGNNAKELQDLAKTLDCVVLVLLQTQKSTGPSDPIQSYRKIKGASVLEQEMRLILSCWRVGYSPANFDDDKYMSLAILKNSMGTLGQVDLKWNGERGIVNPLTPEERQEMVDFVKQKQTLEKLNDGRL